ncbi:MAG: PGPGW domain-containing protein [Woeseiaceae bacterium]
MIKHAANMTYKIARRIAVAVVGSTVLAVGIALIVLPGPAIIVIPIGLAILSLEFAWARLWLKKIRRSISSQGADTRANRAEHHRDRTSL